MRLLIVRHGESTANRDHLVLGQSLPAPLTELGRLQAEAAAATVAGLVAGGPVQLFSSDAVRAASTAQAIADRLGARLNVTPLLREQCLGELEGRPVSELRALPTPAGLDVSEVAWGGGESIVQVHERMRRLLAWLRTRIDARGTVVLVGHGDALCVLQTVLAGRGHRDVDWGHDSLAPAEVREISAAGLADECGDGVSPGAGCEVG